MIMAIIVIAIFTLFPNPQLRPLFQQRQCQRVLPKPTCQDEDGAGGGDEEEEGVINDHVVDNLW